MVYFNQQDCVGTVSVHKIQTGTHSMENQKLQGTF